MSLSGTGLTILIVEDNVGDFTLIEDYFLEVMPDAVLRHAKSYKNAQEFLIAPSHIDCILLDLTLPDLSGSELVTHMTQLAHNIPIIVLTGYSNQEFGLQTLSQGISDYLLKDELNALQLQKSIRYSIERKKISDQLSATEDKYRNIFNFSPAPTWIVDLESYKFLDVNQAAIRHYGYTREEFLSMTLRDIRLQVDVLNSAETIDIPKNTGLFFHGMFSHLKKNGEHIRVEIQSNEIDYDGGKARLVQVTDITDRLIAEQTLIRSEKRFKALVQEGAEMISVLDVNGNYLYVSPASFHVIGYHPESLLEKQPFDFIHPDDLERIRSDFEKLETERRVQVDAYRFKSESGHWLWLETIFTNLLDEPSVKGIVSNTRDVTSRYTFEETLRKQSALLKALVEKSHDMKTLISPEGQILFGTPSVTRILGYSSEEIIGLNERDIIHPDDIDALMQLIDSTLDDISVNYPIELRIRHKQGHYLWCNKVVTNLLSDPDVHAIVCNFWDITAIKESQLRIQESIDRFDKVSRATNDAIWDVDLTTDSIIWNHAFEKMFGYVLPDGKSSSQFWFDRIHEDDQKRVKEKYEYHIQEGIEKWEDEYRFLSADGTYKFVLDRGYLVKNETGQSVRMIGAMQDVTRQKNEEIRLRLLESVITHTSDSVVITEAEPVEGIGPRIIYVNAAFTKMTGYTIEEVLGKTPRILQGEHTSRAQLDVIKNALKSWEPCEVELLNTKKDGDDFWVHLAITPVADSNGHFTHWVAIQRDITERKRQEQDRELLINELTNTNKDLRQFSYITSHNLRAPLSNLIGILNLLENSEIQDKQIASLMSGFKISTHQLNDTINDLIRILVIKDNPSIFQERLLFSEVLEKVMFQLQFKMDEISPLLHIDFSKADTVMFNRTYLESVLLNLFSNALKYRSPNRLLSIRISTEISASGLVLYFNDNGLGLDLERLKGRMFGLYQRFHNHPDSKGMGLYLVKSQLEALGAKMEVESTVDIGTTFKITFKSV